MADVEEPVAEETFEEQPAVEKDSKPWPTLKNQLQKKPSRNSLP